MKKVWIIIGVIVLAGVGFFFYNNYRMAQAAKAAQEAVETVALEMGSLEETVTAIGQVRPLQTASLAWQTSGRVESVEVAEGDQVKAGDILARLKQNSLPQSVILAQADLASAQQKLEDLNTEAENSKVEAMASIVTYEQAVRDAQYTLDNFTIPTAQTKMDAVEAVEKTKTALDEAREAFEPYKFMASGNSTRERLKEDLGLAQSDYNSAIKRLQYEYDLEVAQANLNKAHQDYDKWKNGPVAADLEAAKANIAAAEAAIAQAWLEAPFDGTVTEVEPLVGDQIKSGDQAFRLDNLDTLYVDLEVSEIDINQVAVGQNVSVIFDAIRNKTYHGQVSDVSMISVADNSLVNYTVTIELSDPDEQVRPGMTSEVTISTAQHDNILLIPNEAIQTVNDKQVVYVLKPGEGQAPVEVTLGIASDSYTELLTGDLKAGDQVVLNTSAAENPLMFMMGGPGGGGERPRDDQNQGGSEESQGAPGGQP